MNEYKVIYKEGLFEKHVKYVEAACSEKAWYWAINNAPIPIAWYKSISVKKIEPLTQARYDDMKETAIWDWTILAAVVIAVLVKLW